MENKEKKTITVSLDEYNKIMLDSIKLSYLENNGVDNWVGYEDAIAQFEQDKENDMFDGSV